jgi:hypothetical protein
MTQRGYAPQTRNNDLSQDCYPPASINSATPSTMS